MAVKVGDKVRFLNAIGGGVVVRLGSKGMVYVEDEDGFEIPTLDRECVVVSVREGTNFPIAAAPASAASKSEEKPRMPEAVIKAQQIASLEQEIPGADTIGLWLAFVPTDAQRLTGSSMELHLINDSNYYHYYTVSIAHKGDWKLLFEGKIAPNEAIELTQIAPADLEKYAQIQVGYLPFKIGYSYQARSAGTVVRTIDPIRFYKLHTFEENEFFETKAWMIAIVEGGIAYTDKRISTEAIREAMLSKGETEQPIRKIDLSQFESRKPKDKNSELIEVDLHIHELLDITAGMSAGDILEYQLKEFHKVMGEYIGESGRRIVFIHGKGDGVLRNAILKQLAASYRGCTAQDASFKEYGFGATLVKVR